MRRTAAVTAVALASLTVVACSEADRDELGDTLDSAVDNVQDAVGSVAEDIQQEAGDVVDAAAETAVRNVGAIGGAAAFEDAGYPIDGDLTCEATAGSDASQIDLTCNGTTTEGGAAQLTGRTDEIPGASVTELSGTFTGTVDGTEVFSADSLGG